MGHQITCPTGNQDLAALLDRLRWRPETFARRLNTLARANGFAQRLHHKTPYKWLRGVCPRPPWPALAAALLTQELGQPVSPAQLGWPADTLLAAEPATTTLGLPWTSAGTLQAVGEVAHAPMMDRRVFMISLATAVTAPAHEWLVARPAGQLDRAAGSRLELPVVEHLDAITARLRQMDDQLGSGSLLQLIGAHLRYVDDLLRTRRYTDPVGRRLHATAAELLRLAGWLSFDDGRHAQAQRHFVSALHAAHTAGDRALGGNILGFMSCQAKDLGQHHEAVTLAETARTGYPGASPTVTAILHLRAAEAYANTGETTECRRAIDAAFERLRDPTTDRTAPAWAYWLDEAHAHGQAGYCYLKLGDFDRAQGHFRRSIQLQTPASSREGALRQTLLATVYASQPTPDLERACTAGTHAVGLLGGQVDSDRCLGHLRGLLQLLGPHQRQPIVRDLSDQAQQLLNLRAA